MSNLPPIDYLASTGEMHGGTGTPVAAVGILPACWFANSQDILRALCTLRL